MKPSLIPSFKISAHSSSWPMLLGGVAVGTAQAVNYTFYHEMINLSGAIAGFFAWIESVVLPGYHFFGSAFPAEINSVLAGIFSGAAFIGLMEIGRRIALSFSYRMLVTAFIGGALFGFGANLAGGDYFYHAIGGIALMQLSSLFIIALSIPFVFLSLEIMSVLNTSPLFIPDQQRTGVPATGGPGNGNHEQGVALHKRNAIITAFFAVAFLISAIFQGNGFSSIGLFAGLLVGVVIAKTGFGIEWALLVPDTVRMPPRYMDQLGLPAISIDQLRSAFPLQAWLLAIIIAGIPSLIVWISEGAPNGMPGGLGAPGLHIGHVAGAPLLALGSMLMMGSDFRTYTRTGLGYSSAIMAIIGIVVGNLPFVIWNDDISKWVQANVISSESWLPRLFPDSAVLRAGIWMLFLTALLLSVIYIAAKKNRRV